MKEPTLIKGDTYTDDRGQLGFINDFDMAPVKRFYSVSNHRAGFIRAWHGHKKESKYITVLQGSAIVCAVQIDDWDAPDKDAKVHRFVLSADQPSAVFIPSGYANGFMNLISETKLVIFSTTTVQESLDDDFRYDSRYWDPWQVIER